MPGTTSYTQRFFALLEILKNKSDVQHRFQQIQLVDELLKSYGLSIDRRSVAKALNEIQKSGYPVDYDKGWYYCHEFTRTELDYLTHSVRCNNCLSPEQQTDLLKKISSLGGMWYKQPPDVSSLRTSNQQFMQTLEILETAIAEEVQVEFYYGNYDIDLHLHPRVNNIGNSKLYVINPYQIATVNGRYYLIANVHKYCCLSHYRIDRILDVRKKKRHVKPLTEVEGQGSTIDLPHYIAQHPYMYSGTPLEFRIRVKRFGINDVLDWFGTDIRFENVTNEEADVVVKSDVDSMKLWLKRYQSEAKLVEPIN